MATPAKLLDFFILEAGDYLLRLETLVTQKGMQAADAAQFAAAARGLRGSATMAKAVGVSSLATTVERIANAVVQGATTWEPELQRALVGAIEDLKVMVHGVREWGSEQEARVQQALSLLARYAPPHVEKTGDVIVPISQLFFNDNGQHVVEVAANPKTHYEQQLREQGGVTPGALSASVDRIPTPTRPATPPRASTPARASAPPRGQELRDVLSSSLATMRSLESKRSGPHPTAADLVPIQSLVYRGQRAVERAAEIRRVLRKGGAAPTPALVDELVDLVELATAE